MSSPYLIEENVEIRIVASGGQDVALLEDDVIGILAVGGDSDHVIERAGGVLAMDMDDRLRPLLSLHQALCLESDGGAPRSEGLVVVMRLGAQLFGLLVERVGEPMFAQVLPTVPSMIAVPAFTRLLRAADGAILFALNATWLASAVDVVRFSCVHEPRGAIRSDRAA